MNSSRLPLIDIVECISECIAAQSHITEIYTSSINEMNENSKDGNVVEWYFEDMKVKIEDLKNKYIELYKKRKMLMNIIKDEYDTDMNYRCLVKHTIAIQQFMKEIRDTDRDNIDFEYEYIKASEMMYETLSHFIKTDIVKCWRCLLDSEANGDENKTNKNNTTD